ncbi:hypothetical protein F2Q69_00049015 [Brassica cretica]|uniref:Uncharacterized protein n=1 Tax=Brassica cretica TaxID=69181 RepID=A0A8S9PTL8_BRACR|nr:hypothetical protein F2Q69_00049015 [Brassica cretica]
MGCSSSVVDRDISEDGDGRGGEVEIRDEKTWARLSRGGEEMRYREEDESEHRRDCGGSGVVNSFTEVESKPESVVADSAVAESSGVVFILASPCD